MNTQRPMAVTVAALLLALFSVLDNIISGSPVLNSLSLVAAYGLWALKPWSFWLTISFSVLHVILAATRIALVHDAVVGVVADAVVGVVAPALVILLVVLPTSRRAFVQARTGNA